jgi:hypothetical protein
MSARQIEIARVLEEIRGIVEDFEAGCLEPSDVPVSSVHTESSARLDDVERIVFRLDTSMSPYDASVMRRQHGTFRLARHIGNDHIPTLLWAIESSASRVLDHPDQLRLRILLELLDPASHTPGVLH